MSKIAFIKPSPGGAPRGVKGFFGWLRGTQPQIYGAVMQRVQSGSLGDLGIAAPSAIESEAPASPSLADKIKDIVLGVSTAYLSVEQMRAQRKVLDYQLSRMKQGLAPLDIDMNQMGAGGPSVSVGISSDTQKLLIYGGLAVIAAFFFLRK